MNSAFSRTLALFTLLNVSCGGPAVRNRTGDTTEEGASLEAADERGATSDALTGMDVLTAPRRLVAGALYRDVVSASLSLLNNRAEGSLDGCLLTPPETPDGPFFLSADLSWPIRPSAEVAATLSTYSLSEITSALASGNAFEVVSKYGRWRSHTAPVAPPRQITLTAITTGPVDERSVLILVTQQATEIHATLIRQRLAGCSPGAQSCVDVERDLDAAGLRASLVRAPSTDSDLIHSTTSAIWVFASDMALSDVQAWLNNSLPHLLPILGVPMPAGIPSEPEQCGPAQPCHSLRQCPLPELSDAAYSDLETSVVAGALGALSGLIRQCVENTPTARDARARLQLRFGASGSVSGLCADQTVVDDVVDCLAAHSATLRLPTSSGATDVEVPLVVDVDSPNIRALCTRSPG